MKCSIIKIALVAVLLLLLSGMARAEIAKPISAPNQSLAPLPHVLPQVQHQEMKMREPGTSAPQPPRRAGSATVFYKRPAGAFPGFIAMGSEDHSLLGYYQSTTLQVVPYVPYTYKGVAIGTLGLPHFSWDVNCINPISGYDDFISIDGDQEISVVYRDKMFDVPTMNVTDELDNYSYGMVCNISGQKQTVRILPWPDWGQAYEDEIEVLKSSSDFSYARGADESFYPFTLYSGMMPYGSNYNGFWFGKNGGYNGVHVDGIAQAFEKPEHSYLLKEVLLYVYGLNVTADVDLQCKIYRINVIPNYQDTASVILPEEPGELIAVGSAHLTPNATDDYDSLVPFTLYTPDDGDYSWQVERPITIDDAIMVVIDGYNAPEMSAISSFSAMIGTEHHIDDGYGERAYIKVGKDNAEGNFDGHYLWVGLNNFFSIGEMKTGLSIFLTTELPFLTSNYVSDTYEYTFPAAGGEMERDVIGNNVESVNKRGIQIASWQPISSGDFSITCDGGDLPSWLNIFATDSIVNGKYNYLVNAQVIAQPMEEGTDYREAVVRFAIPGAHMDYKFIQTRQENGDSLMENPVMGYNVNMHDVNVTAGSIVFIPVSMSNQGDVVAMQTDIELPAGFELVSVNGNYNISLSERASTDHTYIATQLSDGKIRVYCFSPSNTPFIGNEGYLFYIAVNVPWDALGDYAVQLWNTRLTLGDLTEYNVDSVVKAILSVEAYINPYDVNGDHEVTVADANRVIDIIINGGSSGHGRQPNGDGEYNDDWLNIGDVNGDNEVNIADVNCIIDRILSAQ